MGAGEKMKMDGQIIRVDAEVEEPLSVAGEAEFLETMYPGQTNTWTWDIVNSAPVAYDIKANLTYYSAPNGVSITSFVVGASDETSDLLDDGSAGFQIPADETLSCSLTITATKDAATGTINVRLDFSRA